MGVFLMASRSRSRHMNRLTRSTRRGLPHPVGHGVEALEDRQLLSPCTVTNRSNSGAGSLRWAIAAANKAPGADTIDFQVAGTIRVARAPLPAITGTVA